MVCGVGRFPAVLNAARSGSESRRYREATTHMIIIERTSRLSRMKRLIGWLLFIGILLISSTLSGAAQGQPNEEDRTRTAQLREAYRQVDGLDPVTLEVRGGVAVLRGEVPSLEARSEAEDLARKIDGIIAVDNGLKIQRGFRGKLFPKLADLQERALDLLSYAPFLLVSIFVIFLSLGLAKTVSRWDWLYQRISNNIFVQDLLRQIFYGTLLLLGILLALEILDATTIVGAILGTAGVVGLAIGFAFKDMAENSIASVLLSIRQPFAPRDHVVIDGSEGRVVRLTSRATILLTLDGNHLRIPNSTVFKATILNYTKNPRRRLSFNVGIDTEENIPSAQTLAVNTLLDCPGILHDPKPQCLVEELGDSTVNLKVVAWVDQDQAEFLKAKSEAVRLVKEVYDHHGVFMPEPIYKVRLEKTEARPKPKKDLPTERELVANDVSPEQHLDAQVIAERAEEEKDLLTPSGRLE